jgi:CsoR family transcriptional regulator, copper-sensing transcriptional repressor
MAKAVKQNQARDALIARLKRIEGQARGIQRMIEEDRDCRQILDQITAMRNATHQVGLLLAQSHAAQCLTQATDADGNATDVEALIQLFARMAS